MDGSRFTTIDSKSYTVGELIQISLVNETEKVTRCFNNSVRHTK